MYLGILGELLLAIRHGQIQGTLKTHCTITKVTKQ